MNKNKITTQTEYLSAFLDDEVGTFEQRRMLDDVQKDEALKNKVARYALIGEAMRNENSCVTVQASFLTGIHDQLNDEPAYSKVHAKKAANQSSWLAPVKGFGGMALVASLALAAVVAITLNNEQAGTLNTAGELAKQHNEAPESKVSAPTVMTALHTPDAAWRDRLKRYVNSHAKYAATSAIMPSVRAVSYASNY